MTLVRLQIKGTFYRSYNDAVLNYNAQDEVSDAVDNMQRRVSHSGFFFFFFKSILCKTNPRRHEKSKNSV